MFNWPYPQFGVKFVDFRFIAEHIFVDQRWFCFAIVIIFGSFFSFSYKFDENYFDLRNNVARTQPAYWVYYIVK